MTLQDLEQMTLAELIEVCDTDPAHIATAESITLDLTASNAQQPRWILSRSWADKHLNSDEDLKYFEGGAVIR